jgi:hypothetical protein
VIMTFEATQPMHHVYTTDSARMAENESQEGWELWDRTLDKIRFEQNSYPCPNRVHIATRFDGQHWVTWARELGRVGLGVGDHLHESLEDFYRKFHVTFQRLYQMRPFEMSDGERAIWNEIVDVVDVARYRENTPLRVREFGQIRHFQTPYPSKIHWIDGRKERINLVEAPPMLAGLRPGQWIEAVVERDAKTGQLMRMIDVQKVPTPPSPTRYRTFWETIEVADLPEVSLATIDEPVCREMGTDGSESDET